MLLGCSKLALTIDEKNLASNPPGHGVCQHVTSHLGIICQLELQITNWGYQGHCVNELLTPKKMVH